MDQFFAFFSSLLPVKQTKPDLTPQLLARRQALLFPLQTINETTVPLAPLSPVDLVAPTTQAAALAAEKLAQVNNYNYYTTNNTVAAGGNANPSPTPTPTTELPYNNVTQRALGPGQSLVFQAGTLHAISYKIISGHCTVTIGNDLAEYVAGEVDSESATATINQKYEFQAGSDPGTLIRIKTITQ